MPAKLEKRDLRCSSSKPYISNNTTRKKNTKKNMTRYIGRDGTVGGQEQKTIRRKISDFVIGIVNFISLFFSAITNPPSAIESRGSYAQRNNGNPYRASGGGGRTLGGGGGGSNIRGVRNLQGGGSVKMGG